MILSAMMFALGAFVSGLAWLGLSVALVRRARRLTERRVLASIATRRAEFETERDELRARHAVEMHRLASEVSRVLDMATAYRLEADVKDNELTSVRAEYAARAEELEEMQQRLAAERDLLQDLERRHAEAGAALRAAQHDLALERRRRSAAEQALDDATSVAEERRLELSALRAETAALRATVDERVREEGREPLRPVLTRPEPVPAETTTVSSVVPLHARPRAVVHEPADGSSQQALESGRVQRLAAEVHGDLARNVWRATAHPEPRMPLAGGLGEPSTSARGASGNGAAAPADHQAAVPPADDAETRFFEALKEIRALKRAASQAGE
ncbi:MAG TPA: hypothetical protein VN240_09870 [Propylenella sp.]|nr:hypothetical protein [Propylenella sp.]